MSLHPIPHYLFFKTFEAEGLDSDVCTAMIENCGTALTCLSGLALGLMSAKTEKTAPSFIVVPSEAIEHTSSLYVLPVYQNQLHPQERIDLQQQPENQFIHIDLYDLHQELILNIKPEQQHLFFYHIRFDFPAAIQQGKNSCLISLQLFDYLIELTQSIPQHE